MATELEHIREDWAQKVEEYGVEVKIDGETVKVFSSPSRMAPADQFERTSMVVKDLFHLSGTIEQKVPEQIVVVDGKRWTVVEHIDYGVSVRLTISRSFG